MRIEWLYDSHLLSTETKGRVQLSNDDVVSELEVRAELERILASSLFIQSERLGRFLVSRSNKQLPDSKIHSKNL